MAPQQVAQILSDLILCDKILLRNKDFHEKILQYTQSDLSRALRRVAATCLIGQLHDDVILLQLPESLSLLFSCANLGYCSLILSGIDKFK